MGCGALRDALLRESLTRRHCPKGRRFAFGVSSSIGWPSVLSQEPQRRLRSTSAGEPIGLDLRGGKSRGSNRTRPRASGWPACCTSLVLMTTAKKRRRVAKRPTRNARNARKTKAARSMGRYWSAEVTSHSDALDLEESVFKRSPREIARSLKRSAERSTRRKTSPFRSAMSMLTFYENRAGRNLSPNHRAAIQRAKEELRKLYGRTPSASKRSG